MRLHTKTRSLLIIASLGLFLSNCGGGDNETPTEKIELAKLKGEWTVKTVTYGNDDTDVTDDFDGVTLTISGTFSKSSPEGPYDYEIDGTLPEVSPWPKAGTTDGKWSFVAAEDGLVLRDPDSGDELAMNYSISGGELTIQFVVDGDGWEGGKAANVSGSWEFVFE